MMQWLQYNESAGDKPALFLSERISACSALSYFESFESRLLSSSLNGSGLEILSDMGYNLARVSGYMTG